MTRHLFPGAAFAVPGVGMGAGTHERALPVDPPAAEPEAAEPGIPVLSALPSLSRSADWASQVTSVAIIRLDAAGRVRTWNPGAERIKGYAARDIIGESFEGFYREQDRASRLPARLLELAARQGSAEHAGWRVRADGSLFWAYVIITAIRDEHSELTGYVKLTRDLSSVRRQDQQRQSFLRAFAHDFLSPITALRGYVDLLEDAAPEHRDLVQRVSTVSDHLVAMMDELTGYIEGTAAESLAPVDIAALVREAGALVLPDASARLVIDGGEPRLVRTQPPLLRRALANVLDNAAKYSDGAIHVTIADDGDDIAVRISDTGRGIEAADLPTIFDAYERGRLADPADGGTGIGLASVREIVERVGGRVAIASTPGVGTTVTLSLPPAAPLSR